jgi:hypothetical protein
MYYTWYRDPVKVITRRELAHQSARVLDDVLASGEPVEVRTRGGRSVVISLKPESTYERWIREGLAVEAAARPDRAPRASSPRTVESLLGEIASDH